MKNKPGIILGFIVTAILVGIIYYAGRQRKPLVYAIIPDVTTSWIEQLTTFNTVSVTVVDKGPFNWENEDDLGQRFEGDWNLVDSDPNFIVYYKNDDMHLNVQNARRVLQIANETIPEIQELMGRYAFPADCNGRKLSIYITSSPAEYQSTVDLLYGSQANSSSSSIGMFICHIGPLGCLPDGIVLHPKCFDYESSPLNWAESVLRHEMNHYAYFMSLDYGKEIRHPLWVSEGLADFASKPKSQVASKDSVDYIRENCHVLEEFPRERHAEYWAGKSFYTFVEREKGLSSLKAFIQNLRTNDIEGALTLSFEDATKVDSLWVGSLVNPLPTIDSLPTPNSN